jgi:hypothetical protein
MLRMEEHRFQSALINHPEHARMLGLIADTCNLIERILCDAMAMALSIPSRKAEAIFYSLQASRSRFEVAKTCLKRFAGEQFATLYVGQIAKAQKLFGRRSAMIHNIWQTRKRGDAGILDLSEPAKSRARDRPISIKEMEKLLSELEDCLNAILDISIAAHAWKP